MPRMDTALPDMRAGGNDLTFVDRMATWLWLFGPWSPAVRDARLQRKPRSSCAAPRPERLAATVLTLLLGSAAEGNGFARDLPALCEDAARSAARANGIPEPVMLALTHVETGRGDSRGGMRPWPWALNIEGRGAWPPTRDAALVQARDAIARGQTSVDLGCFQINYRWHGQAFASLDAMIDPAINAAYAARFLHEQYSRLGSWRQAAGAYHSRSEAHAARYRARFDQALARLARAPDTDASERAGPAVGRVSPQLVASGPWGHGSLLPRASADPSTPSETATAGAIAMGMLR